jgi:hypothetical protein
MNRNVIYHPGNAPQQLVIGALVAKVHRTPVNLLALPPHKGCLQ